MDEIIAAYFDAWNEPDSDRRHRLLKRAVTADAELVDPTGHWQGIPGISERIDRYQSAAPATRVLPSSAVDAHRDLVRYSWTILDPEGTKSSRESTSPNGRPTGISGGS